MERKCLLGSHAKTQSAGWQTRCGTVDLVENRFVGMKSRGVYETPGGSILLFAHRQIESLTMDREVMHLRDSLIPKYAELVYYGFWFAPEREALQALVSDSQKYVTGRVRIKLYKGNIITAGRQSPLSLYNPEIATMEADPTQACNQDDATGFIRLNGLRLKVAAQVHLAQKPAKKQRSVHKSKGTRKGKTSARAESEQSGLQKSNPLEPPHRVRFQ